MGDGTDLGKVRLEEGRVARGAEDRGEMVVRMQDWERNALETICSTVSGMMAAALPAEAGNE